MARKLARNVSLIVVFLAAALALFVYFTPTGRAWLARAWSAKSNDGNLALAQQVRSALSLSRRLSDYAINVEAKSGVVTLSGQVPTEIDKGLAENVARGIPNVSGLTNQLQVQPGLKPAEAGQREAARVADLEIRAELNERLSASPGLQGQNIQTTVQGRTVTLTGRVETPAQKTGAEQLARNLPQVAQVINQLEVAKPDAPSEGQPESKDKDLTNRVLFALFQEREDFSDVGAIKAASQDGQITLSGTAASRAERALAERIVRDVDGVKTVTNQLTVAPPRKDGK